MASVAPFTAADTSAAAYWSPFVSAAYHGPETVAEADAKARRAISLLEHRGIISGGAAALLLQIFDLAPLDQA